MNILAVIPAKDDSTRLDGKNLKKIGGKTLIEIAVNHAKMSNLVTDVVVSTDSERIKNFVESNGICECIIREPTLSGEDDVFLVYKSAWEAKGSHADYVVGLQPDNPDRTLILFLI